MTSERENPLSPRDAFRDLALRIMYGQDLEHTAAFLLCYTSYEPSDIDLLTIWIEEFVKACEKERNEEFKRQVKKPLIERMLDFLRVWVTRYDANFKSKRCEQILDILKEYAEPFVNEFKLLFVRNSSMRASNSGEPDSAKRGPRSSVGSGTDRSSSPGPLSLSNPSSPQIPQSPDLDRDTDSPFPTDESNFNIELLHSASTVARQLTIYEFNIFRAIKPEEFLNQNWMKKDRFELAPNIIDLIEHSNRVSTWVAVEILLTQSKKNQAIIIKKFIRIAEESILINNFNTAMEIIAGLNHSSIQRLKEIWQLVGDKYEAKYQYMDTLMQPRNNFQAYRRKLRESSLPTFPQLSLLLRDFTYIYDGNDKYDADGAINFDLCTLIHERMEEVRRHQSVRFDFPPNPKVLKQMPKLISYDWDEDKLYLLSLNCQPSLWSPTISVNYPCISGGSTESIDEEDSSTLDIDSETASAITDPTSSRSSSRTGSLLKTSNDADFESSGERSISSSGSERVKKKSKKSPSLSPASSSVALIVRSNSPDTSSAKPSKVKKSKSQDDTTVSASPPSPRNSANVPGGLKHPQPLRPASPLTGEQKPQVKPKKHNALKRRHIDKHKLVMSKGAIVAAEVPQNSQGLFIHMEKIVERFFSQIFASARKGTIELGEQRYCLIRAASFSVDFFKFASKIFKGSSTDPEDVACKLLYNIGRLTAKSDCRLFARQMELKTSSQRFAAGPLYQAFAGLSYHSIDKKMDCLINTPDSSTYCLVTEHKSSAEASAWKQSSARSKQTRCLFLSGYTSGWISESYSDNFVGVEITCKSRGDKSCQTIVCAPHMANEHIARLAPNPASVEIPTELTTVKQFSTIASGSLRERGNTLLRFKKDKAIPEARLPFSPQRQDLNPQDKEEKEQKLHRLENKSVQYFGKLFENRDCSASKGSVTIDGESYIFMRGEAISKEFFDTIRYTFSKDADRVRATELAYDLLFDFAFALGQSDQVSFCSVIARNRFVEDVKTATITKPLHPLSQMLGLKEVFTALGFGKVIFDYKTQNLVYDPEQFFFHFWLTDSIEASVWTQDEESGESVGETLVRRKGTTDSKGTSNLKTPTSPATPSVRSKLGGFVDNERSPVCVISSGYAHGFIQKCFMSPDITTDNKKERQKLQESYDASGKYLDLGVAEIACKAQGHDKCEFICVARKHMRNYARLYLQQQGRSDAYERVRFYRAADK